MKLPFRLSIALGALLLVAAGIVVLTDSAPPATRNLYQTLGKKAAPPSDSSPQFVSGKMIRIPENQRDVLQANRVHETSYPRSLENGIAQTGSIPPHRQRGTSFAGVSEGPRPADIRHATPDVELSVPEWTPLSTNTPGASLSLAGNQAVVVATQPVPKANNPSLSITITPSAEPLSEIAAGENNHIPRRGFTYEEELFRTKWGWTAHDQVQQVLREETSD